MRQCVGLLRALTRRRPEQLARGHPRILWPFAFDRLGAHAGRTAARLGVMGTAFCRPSDAEYCNIRKGVRLRVAWLSPGCKGGVLFGAPTTDGGQEEASSKASRASMSLVPAWHGETKDKLFWNIYHREDFHAFHGPPPGRRASRP